VCLGLKYSTDQIPLNTSDPIEKDRLQTLSETSMACEAALNILNELLLYDKIEKGILELNKENIPVLDLINTSARMFSIMLREKTIRLTVDTSVHQTLLSITNEGKNLRPIAIDSDDMIFGDRNKLEQVLRNIISNAIKFTPDEGIIKIKLKFIPQRVERNQGLEYENMNERFTLHRNIFAFLNISKRWENPDVELPNINIPLPVSRILLEVSRDYSTITARNSYKLTSTSRSAIDSVTGREMTLPTTVTDSARDQISLGSTFDSSRTFVDSSRELTPSIDVVDNTLSEVVDEKLTELSGILVIEITDNGAGISRENQKRLFNEIVQFEPEKLQSGGGSGLGMWISKTIVERHDGKMLFVCFTGSQLINIDKLIGTIGVYSAGEGKGSTFSIHFPMKKIIKRSTDNRPLPISRDLYYTPLTGAQRSIENSLLVVTGSISDDSENIQSRMSQPDDLPRPHTISFTDNKTNNSITRVLNNPSPPTHQQTRQRLLLVDDSPMNLKMLCRILTAQGYVCDQALDGREAVNMIKVMVDETGSSIEGNTTNDINQYDGVIMDYMMPNLDGPSAAQEMRALGYTGPIIGVTGNAVLEDQHNFIRAGASCVLIKPLNTEALNKILLGIL
jgi:signal transduction histidine kinase/CheY-like chemotaxis protein